MVSKVINLPSKDYMNLDMMPKLRDQVDVCQWNLFEYVLDNSSIQLDHHHYTSLNSYFKLATKDIPLRDRFSRRLYGSDTFNSSSNWDNFSDLIPSWDDGAKALMKEADRISSELGDMTVGKGKKFKFAGSSVSMSRYLQGRSNVFRAKDRRSGSEKVVDIVVDGSFACGSQGCTSKTCFNSSGRRPKIEQIMARGVVIYLIAKGLEMAGYKTRITIAMHTYYQYSSLILETITAKPAHIKIKNNYQLLRQLSLPLLHESWYTRLNLAAIENYKHNRGSFYPRDLGNILPLPRKIGQIDQDNAIMFHNMTNWGKSKISVASLVDDMLAELRKVGVYFK